MPYLLYNEDENLLLNEDGNLLYDGNLYSAVYFANQDSKYIDFPSYPAVNPEYNEPFSWHVVFSIKTFTFSSVVIMDKREFNNAPGEFAEGYGLGYFGMQPYFVLGGNATLGGTRQFDYFFLDFTLQLNRRYSILVTKTAGYNTPDAYKGYVNEKQVNITSFSAFPFTQSIKQDLPIRFGATQGTDPHTNLDGYVYKSSFYNTTLDLADAQHLYYTEGDTPPGREANRVFYMPLKEKEGLVAVNEDGSDGLFTGFTMLELAIGTSNRRVDPYTLLPILK